MNVNWLEGMLGGVTFPGETYTNGFPFTSRLSARPNGLVTRSFKPSARSNGFVTRSLKI